MSVENPKYEEGMQVVQPTDQIELGFSSLKIGSGLSRFETPTKLYPVGTICIEGMKCADEFEAVDGEAFLLTSQGLVVKKAAELAKDYYNIGIILGGVRQVNRASLYCQLIFPDQNFLTSELSFERDELGKGFFEQSYSYSEEWEESKSGLKGILFSPPDPTVLSIPRFRIYYE